MEKGDKIMFKKISVLALVLIMVFSVLSISAFAETEIDGISDETAFEDIVSDAEEGAKESSVNPMNFIKNLDKMGVGMIGIFVVIGAIIISVAALNKVTSPRKENKDE